MTKPIVLDPEQVSFVEGLVADGRYPSPDEAVTEELRLLHACELRLSDWREARSAGVESGDYEPLEGVLDELANHYVARARADA